MVSSSILKLVVSSPDLNFYPVSPDVFPRPAADPNANLT
jgi:alpha-glucosidase (family GH31 glycosyl hydrolase)